MDPNPHPHPHPNPNPDPNPNPNPNPNPHPNQSLNLRGVTASTATTNTVHETMGKHMSFSLQVEARPYSPTPYPPKRARALPPFPPYLPLPPLTL